MASFPVLVVIDMHYTFFLSRNVCVSFKESRVLSGGSPLSGEQLKRFETFALPTKKTDRDSRLGFAIPCHIFSSSSSLPSSQELSDTKSASLKNEPSSEPLHISGK